MTQWVMTQWVHGYPLGLLQNDPLTVTRWVHFTRWVLGVCVTRWVLGAVLI